MTNSIAPEKAKDKSLKELCDILKGHFSQKPLQIAERFRFHKRIQREGESISEFVASLKQMSIHCAYEGNVLDYSLRDQFIVGLNNGQMQKKLLSKDDSLTFSRAVEIAQAMEQANDECSKMQTKTENVHFVKSKQHRKSSSQSQTKTARKPCFRCGLTNHSPDGCFHINAKCDYCSKIGHIEKVCLSKKQSKKKRGQSQNEARRRRPGYTRAKDSIHHMENYSSESEYSDELFSLELNSVQNSDKPSPPKFTVDAKVDGAFLKMELDTGSARSIMSETQFKDIFPSQKLKSTTVSFKTYTGELVHPLGKFHPTVKLNGQTRKLPLYV